MVTLNHLTGFEGSCHHAISTVFFAHLAFADRASVLALEPGGDALCVESVQTGQDDVLFVDLVLALADGTLLVLLREVLQVCLCEIGGG